MTLEKRTQIPTAVRGLGQLYYVLFNVTGRALSAVICSPQEDIALCETSESLSIDNKSTINHDTNMGVMASA